MKYSKGVMWLDDCRIPFVNEGDIPNNMDKTHLDGRNFYTQVYNGFMYNQNTQGRFTPNLLVCDDILNDGNITKKSNPKITAVGIGRGVIGNHDGRKTITKAKEGMEMLRSVGDGGSNSRFYDLDKWFDNIIDSL
jgi:hypothetical protein